MPRKIKIKLDKPLCTEPLPVHDTRSEDGWSQFDVWCGENFFDQPSVFNKDVKPKSNQGETFKRGS